MISNVCSNQNANNSSSKFYKSGYYYTTNDGDGLEEHLLPLNQDDILVVAAGHSLQRGKYISTYKQFFDCIQQRTTTTTSSSSRSHNERWPHFFYQLASVSHFWTIDGRYPGSSIPRHNIPDDDGQQQHDWKMSCRPNVPTTIHRNEERKQFNDLNVSFLGDDQILDNIINGLGEYHVGYGDCLHWIQPGIPDLYAAQLADYVLMLTTTTTK